MPQAHSTLTTLTAVKAAPSTFSADHQPVSTHVTVNPPENGVQYTPMEVVRELHSLPADMRGARTRVINSWIAKGLIPCTGPHCLRLLRKFKETGYAR